MHANRQIRDFAEGTHAAASCLTSGQGSCCRGAARGQGRRRLDGQGAAHRDWGVWLCLHCYERLCECGFNIYMFGKGAFVTALRNLK